MNYRDLTRHWPTPWLVRTYRVTPELVRRLSATACAHQVGISDLVRYLLDTGLYLVERGELQIPTRPDGLHRIVHDR